MNYQYFGRCIDTTNQHVQATWLIGYPCKQDPLATNLTWNQKWYTGVSNGDGGTTTRAAAVPGGTGHCHCYNSPATRCRSPETQACQFMVPQWAMARARHLHYYCLEAGNTASPSAPVNGTIVTSQPCSTTDHYQKWTYTK